MNEQAKETIKQKMREQFEARLDAMAAEAVRFTENPGAVTLRDMEKKINAILDQTGDEIAESILRGELENPEVQNAAIEASKKNTGCTTGEGRQPSNSSTEGP